MAWSWSAVTGWGKWRRLPWSERILLLQALALLTLLASALRFLGFRRSRDTLARFLGGRRQEAVLGQARTIARLVEVAARNAPCRSSCLHRSLVLWWLLRRRGLAADLRIGVRRTSGKLEAHAWVEHQGVVLNDGGDVARRFTPFDRTIIPQGA
jgi:hypothetical protein